MRPRAVAAIFSLLAVALACSTAETARSADPVPEKGKAEKTVTGDHGARLAVRIPDSKLAKEAAGIEITVRPDTFSQSERYVISALAVRSDGKEEVLGNHAFFAPPKLGEPTTFFVDPPASLKNAAPSTDSFEIEVRIKPVEPGAKLTESKLTALSATLVR